MVHLPDDDDDDDKEAEKESQELSESETASGNAGDPSQTSCERSKRSQFDRLQLKQIEMNTFSVAGICHATNVANMHRSVRYLSNTASSYYLLPTYSSVPEP